MQHGFPYLYWLKFLLIAETTPIYLPDPPGYVCIEDWINDSKCNQDCIDKGFEKGGTRIVYLNQYLRCCCYND